MGVLLVAGKDNLFTEPSGLAKEGKELRQQTANLRHTILLFSFFSNYKLNKLNICRVPSKNPAQFMKYIK
jgi:hypothetical protein